MLIYHHTAHEYLDIRVLVWSRALRSVSRKYCLTEGALNLTGAQGSDWGLCMGYLYLLLFRRTESSSEGVYVLDDLTLLASLEVVHLSSNECFCEIVSKQKTINYPKKADQNTGLLLTAEWFNHFLMWPLSAWIKIQRRFIDVFLWFMDLNSTPVSF